MPFTTPLAWYILRSRCRVVLCFFFWVLVGISWFDVLFLSQKILKKSWEATTSWVYVGRMCALRVVPILTYWY